MIRGAEIRRGKMRRLTAFGAAAFLGFGAAFALVALGFASFGAAAFLALGAALGLAAAVFFGAAAFFALGAAAFFSVFGLASFFSGAASLVPPDDPVEELEKSPSEDWMGDTYPLAGRRLPYRRQTSRHG